MVADVKGSSLVDGNGNGAGSGERPNGVQRITLTFTPETFHLHIDCDTVNLDAAMSMLQQAERAVESKLRIASAIALQKEMQDAQRTAAIVNRVGKTGLRA